MVLWGLGVVAWGLPCPRCTLHHYSSHLCEQVAWNKELGPTKVDELRICGVLGFRG